eukprot:gene34730-57558_t
MFTNNGVPGTNATKQPVVEKAALGGVIAVLVADVLGLTGAPLAILVVLAAAAHAWRLALWRPWKTVRVPLVWVLHAAYAWVPIHLLLRGLAELELVVPSLATHALTVGAAGGLIIGTMTRTARGHTGRPLIADRYETACYLLVLLAALLGGAVTFSLGLWQLGRAAEKTALQDARTQQSAMAALDGRSLGLALNGQDQRAALIHRRMMLTGRWLA